MNAVSEILQTFFAEARELLARMEESLLRLENDPADTDAIHAAFRAAHTIKGSAGLFDLKDIVAFTHKAESLLVKLRDGSMQVDEMLIALLLRCCDHLGALLDCAGAGAALDPALREQDHELGELLDGLNRADMPALVETPVASTGADGPSDTDAVWHVSVRYFPDVFRKGMSPSAVMRELARIGELGDVHIVADAIPQAASMDPESCYLGFEIRLAGALDKNRIEEAFEFVREDCELRILPPGSQVADFVRLIEVLPEDNARLGELLVACGAITRRELATLLDMQGSAHPPGSGGSKVGELAIETRAVHPQVVEAALKKQGEARRRQALEAQLLRVQASKLDALIDRVGELVIASAGVGQVAIRLGDAELHESVSAMARLIEDLRDGAMRLRMVEIGETFNRFRRIVRDVAQQLGKDIELTIAGADTELDKSLVEQIADPLTHLVRNAIDHGIESSEQRLAAGKPARGHVRLDAHHEAGNVIIEVSDDGGGLNREAILAKARQKGLIAADASPADAEVWQLIFEPGFSTAQQVSDLSGRGVGMDVVRRNIESLRGSIEIESKPQQGSRFRICLPLTLAIIDGFLVGVADSHYVVPLDTVVECVDVTREALGKGYVELRGEALPLLSLRRHFGLRGARQCRESILVVAGGRRRAGLVVDHLDGELQAVIKPLGPLFARLSGIAGSTILGSGEVALVLDVPLLLADATCRKANAARHVITQPPD